MKRILNILFWSVIAAAFIGPGTVTTAASAGSDFGLALAWALLFSVVACLVLQEASGRITVVTGKELGEAIRARFGGWVAGLVAFGIVLGCAAYEAGNLLGGVAGLRLLTDVSPGVLTLIAGIGAALLLATGNTRWIARILGALVAFMGIAFVITAIRLGPDMLQLVDGLFIPRIPAGSTVLVLGLVGTTVVPYNLFLGSALARDCDLTEMRWGLGVAVIGGGIISLGVLVVRQPPSAVASSTQSWPRYSTFVSDRAPVHRWPWVCSPPASPPPSPRRWRPPSPSGRFSAVESPKVGRAARGGSGQSGWACSSPEWHSGSPMCARCR